MSQMMIRADLVARLEAIAAEKGRTLDQVVETMLDQLAPTVPHNEADDKDDDNEPTTLQKLYAFILADRLGYRDRQRLRACKGDHERPVCR